jgi:hypothetical protein
MVRTIPGARRQLRELLAGPRRPTWIIRQNRANSFGFDPRGRTAALLARRYRTVARVCGTPILLARGAPARPAPAAAPGDCPNLAGGPSPGQ